MSTFQHYRRSLGQDATYRSPEEERLAQHMEKAGLRFTYEERKLRYTHLTKTTYKTDFEVATPIGPVLVEVKGFWTHQNRQKVRQVLKSYPEINLVMAFIKPTNKISAQSKTTYAMFCEKNNIPWLLYHDLINTKPECLPRLLIKALAGAGSSSSTSLAPGATAQTELPGTTTATGSASPAPPA